VLGLLNIQLIVVPVRLITAMGISVTDIAVLKPLQWDSLAAWLSG